MTFDGDSDLGLGIFHVTSNICLNEEAPAGRCIPYFFLHGKC